MLKLKGEPEPSPARPSLAQSAPRPLEPQPGLCTNRIVQSLLVKLDPLRSVADHTTNHVQELLGNSIRERACGLRPHCSLLPMSAITDTGTAKLDSQKQGTTLCTSVSKALLGESTALKRLSRSDGTASSTTIRPGREPIRLSSLQHLVVHAPHLCTWSVFVHGLCHLGRGRLASQRKRVLDGKYFCLLRPNCSAAELPVAEFQRLHFHPKNDIVLRTRLDRGGLKAKCLQARSKARQAPRSRGSQHSNLIKTSRRGPLSLRLDQSPTDPADGTEVNHLNAGL